jgi:transposase
LVEAIESGMTQKAAAAAFCVAPATAHRWWHRRLEASSEEVRSGCWLLDRSSRPHHSPRLLDGDTQKRICEWRRRTGWGPRLVAGKVGHHHSTVWKVLCPSRHLAASEDAARGGPRLRVALPRRRPAHGHIALRAL